MKKITITAFERSLVPIFDVLMPNPKVTYNEKTGMTEREYVNSTGNVF